jgi:maleate cis-trans isomerase
MSKSSVRPKRIGIIFPDEGAYSYELLNRDFMVRWFAEHGFGEFDYLIERTPGGKPMSLEGCAELAKEDELIPAAQRLLKSGVDVILWACVSASFHRGASYAREQARMLSGGSGIPATSSSLAMMAAAKNLGATKVDVMMNYMPEVANGLLNFISQSGLEVGDVRHMTCRPEQRAFDLNYKAELVSFTEQLSPRKHPLLIPSTSLSSLDVITEFEDIAGRPVMTANQASIWHVLALLGIDVRTHGAGALFE